MLTQVEFLIEGNLLPPTIGRLKVSEKLIIEKAMSKNEFIRAGDFAFAYVGEDESDFFGAAVSYMDFFLLMYALTSGTPATHFVGSGIEISKLGELGKERVSFSGYEKVTVLHEDMQSELSKPILLAKDRFLQLEADRKRIMNEYIGLALRYYYYAVQANSRGRFAEVVVDLAIAAEVLFSKEKPFTSNLKRRLSSFIVDDKTEREEIKKRIDDFYVLRGLIVHGIKKISWKKDTLDDVRIVSGYVRKAIDKALSLKLYTKDELVRKGDTEAAHSP